MPTLYLRQTVISHVSRVRLGGATYQPSSSCPLNAHTKQLSSFLDHLHLLYTALEDNPQPRTAAKRVLFHTSRYLAKEYQWSAASIQSAREKLQQLLEAVEGRNSVADTLTPDKPASLGGSAVGRESLRLLQHVLDVCAARQRPSDGLDLLTEALTCSQGTPRHLPALVTQFRSPDTPEGVAASPEERPLRQRLREQPQVQQLPRPRSCFTWAPDAQTRAAHQTRDVFQTVVDYVCASKTIAHPAPWRSNAPLNDDDDDDDDMLEAGSGHMANNSDPPNNSNAPSGNPATLEPRGGKRAEVAKRKSSAESPRGAKRCPLTTLQENGTEGRAVGKRGKKGGKVAKEPRARRKLLAPSKGQTKLTSFFKA